MSELQAQTYEMLMRIPEEKLKIIVQLLFQTILNGDDFESDLEYFQSIPGFLERLDEAANTPWEECLPESEVNW